MTFAAGRPSALRSVRAALGLALAALPACAGLEARAEEAPSYTDLVTVVHLHTTLSDGLASPLEMARAARLAGVDVLVVTDHFIERVEYAPWPLGNVMGIAVSRPSVMSNGVAVYLKTLASAEAETGTLVLPGIEVSPYARWSGSLLTRSLRLDGWHRHALVIGIEDAGELRRLPVAGNRAGGGYAVWSLVYLLPAAAFAWSARRALRPAWRETRMKNFVLRRRRVPMGEVLLASAALLLLVLGFPFKVEAYSAVAADPGDAPFRLLVDRVHELGGFVAWAHPEAAADKEFHGVRLATEPYGDLVLKTDADAFGAMPEGVTSLLPIGGLWDQALRQHVAGRRHSAPFALAEVDEHRPAGEIDFGILQTVLQVRERTHAGVLEAMKAGRMYGRWSADRKPPLILAQWSVTSEGASAIAGETLRCRAPVTLRLAVSGGDGAPAMARLVRDGKVIWSNRASPPFTAAVEDDTPGATSYRLDVEGPYPYRLISNPIFIVRPRGAQEGA
jgi:hypothetical protein